MEVVADHRAADPVAIDEHARDEVGGFERGERAIELHHDGAVECGGREEPELGVAIAEPKQRLVRREEGARMRIEGEHRRRAAEPARAGNRSGDHRAMAAMHALEIADRDHRASERAGMRRQLERVLDDDERWAR